MTDVMRQALRITAQTATRLDKMGEGQDIDESISNLDDLKLLG